MLVVPPSLKAMASVKRIVNPSMEPMLRRAVSRSKITSQWHRPSRDANPHHEIPDHRERPEQRTDHEQPHRTVRQPTPVAPQTNVTRIQRGNPSGAECHYRDQKRPGRNRERRKNPNDEK